jgi:lipid A disaccharide synthetase
MGFVEVLFNLKTILAMPNMQNDIAEFKPDVIILLTILANMRIANGQKKILNTLLHIAPNMGLERKSHHYIKRCR